MVLRFVLVIAKLEAENVSKMPQFLVSVCILYSVLIPMVGSGVGFCRQDKLRALREYG